MSPNTIPKKALVVLQDLLSSTPGQFMIADPEAAKVSAFDRSFQFGDSLYEVTRSYDGILFSIEEHLRRLCRSAELAMWEEPPDLDRLVAMTKAGCRAFYSKFGNSDVYVRWMVSRGIGDLNIDRRVSSPHHCFVFIKELEKYSSKLYDQGVHYAIVDRRRNLPSALDPAMKSGNYLNNVLAMSEARRRGADDALMLNHQGFVTEGTTNNVYAVKNGEIWTAPLSVGILAGITREWIFQICKAEGIVIQERLFTPGELVLSEEMFLTSATKEVMPITKLNGAPVGNGLPGPVTKRLHKGMKQLIAEYCDKRRDESLYV